MYFVSSRNNHLAFVLLFLTQVTQGRGKEGDLHLGTSEYFQHLPADTSSKEVKSKTSIVQKTGTFIEDVADAGTSRIEISRQPEQAAIRPTHLPIAPTAALFTESGVLQALHSSVFHPSTSVAAYGSHKVLEPSQASTVITASAETSPTKWNTIVVNSSYHQRIGLQSSSADANKTVYSLDVLQQSSLKPLVTSVSKASPEVTPPLSVVPVSVSKDAIVSTGIAAPASRMLQPSASAPVTFSLTQVLNSTHPAMMPPAQLPFTPTPGLTSPTALRPTTSTHRLDGVPSSSLLISPSSISPGSETNLETVNITEPTYLPPSPGKHQSRAHVVLVWIFAPLGTLLTIVFLVALGFYIRKRRRLEKLRHQLMPLYNFDPSEEGDDWESELLSEVKDTSSLVLDRGKAQRPNSPPNPKLSFSSESTELM